MLRRTSKYLIPAAIVLFWLVMMGLLVRRELFAPKGGAGQGRASHLSLEPTDTWMGIFGPKEKRIGFAHTWTMPGEREGVPGTKMHLSLKLRLTLLGATTEIIATGSGWVPHEEGIAEFEARMLSGQSRFHLEATVAGGQLDAKVHTAGETIPFRMPVEGSLTQRDLLGAAFTVEEMVPGGAYSVDAFDPMAMSATQAHIRCLAEETLEVAGETVETKVVMMTVGAIAMKAWITLDDEVVRVETPFGLTLMKISPEEAELDSSDSDAADVVSLASIRPTGKPVSRGATRMVVRLAGIPASTLVPSDDTQRRDESGAHLITVPPAPVRPHGATLVDESLGLYLKGDALVQTTHPAIVRMATSVVGHEADPWRQARLLHDWLSENIEKVPTVSIPSALEVLATKKGDCNEHAILFTALARALGIPTRIALGIVWSEEYHAFCYHAWPEVHVGRWIWIDPTLGQPIADATHIKLVTGGIGQWTQLALYLGQLEVEVVEVE